LSSALSPPASLATLPFASAVQKDHRASFVGLALPQSSQIPHQQRQCRSCSTDNRWCVVCLPPVPTIQTRCNLHARFAALVRSQLNTAARPGELVLMRTGDIDRSKKIWVFKPHHHKTAYKGHSREIYLGPKAQEIVT